MDSVIQNAGDDIHVLFDYIYQLNPCLKISVKSLSVIEEKMSKNSKTMKKRVMDHVQSLGW